MGQGRENELQSIPEKNTTGGEKRGFFKGNTAIDLREGGGEGEKN